MRRRYGGLMRQDFRLAVVASAQASCTGTESFFAHNGGKGVYEVDTGSIDLTAKTATVSLVGESDPSGLNDGMNCMTVPPPPEWTTTTTTCLGGTCEVWGDPHISVFDNAKMSLLSSLSSMHHPGSGSNNSNANLKIGDFWLVRSKDVHIQGRYNVVLDRRHKPFLRAVAVGGPFLQGNTLTVGSQQGEVFWNDQKILTYHKEDEFNVNGLVSAKYIQNETLIQDASKRIHGIDLELPLGVKMEVNRHSDILGVRIRSGKLEGGQEGECGNFNGEADDDTEEQVAARGTMVRPVDVLFQTVFNPYQDYKEQQAR